MEIREIDELTDRRELKKGQKVELLRDFYDTTDLSEDRKPVHRMGDVGKINGFGEIYSQEIVTVEICHHGLGIFEVVPLRPSDVKIAPDETPVTEPDQRLDDPDESPQSLEEDQPVILLDIKKAE
ncbi:MAG: hypothetical protein JSV84_03350 [Gemmatimonadota bacterium]|nr:MAG: hypothetical protein JSV84_03350 [Gemmatimonadota bacterium]